ncbi:5-formyltetrahydrofolate cyclo-ligase [Paenibacillus sp. 481]|uniref:5-formyltetrahydrofolate cyclo-ligase n=1 Tax=Paenibacillus sp. 481 TaxID=2835869 RepID=UPI001E5BBE1A|nr:5-formyltetrahydrofolate cyclo-ligase [Paenibacillus sp. 481]UHA71991.1 5-formyltetrahydrofolate cyclo-ligase [Paenibacillus sp. 481]
MHESKAELRKRMKQRRANVPTHEQHAAANAVYHFAVPLLDRLRQQVGRSLSVFGYIPFGGELNIGPVLQYCQQAGDHIYVPRTHAEQKQMTLHRWDSNLVMHTNAWGLQEPAPETELWPEASWSSIDVIFVPGIAFDADGGRLGFGGGYYDRFWERFKQFEHDKEQATQLIGCVYSWQLVDRIPMEPHDIAVNVIITEQGVVSL